MSACVGVVLVDMLESCGYVVDIVCGYVPLLNRMLVDFYGVSGCQCGCVCWCLCVACGAF